MARVLDLKMPESFSNRWLKANDYVNSGQLEQALGIFESLAADGYSEACVEIGNIFEQGGNGVTQNLDAARRWYMKAIDEIDDDYAYVGLARLAIQGYSDAGTPSDAVEYLRRAIEVNNPMALIILGTLYHSGKVIPKDLHHAAQLYEKAWAQGYVLPLAYLSKVKVEQGHYLVGLWMHLKAIWVAYQLMRKDPSDPRLWNYI
jgi:TPR repeat protein